MSSRQPWQLDAPLDRGLTVLEASAGTGKTWQIAHLVVRLVTEEDVRAGRLLVVTYTKAATAELRDRIRRRLGEAVRALVDAEAATLDDGLDLLRRRALEGGHQGRWLQRLRRAQEELDEATISTIHGFCQRMLRQHAFDSGADLDLELIGDPVALRGEVVDDLLSETLHDVTPSRYHFLTGRAGFRRGELLEGMRAATEDPDLVLLPDPGGPPPTPDGVRAEVAAFLADFDADALVEATEDAATDGRLHPAEGKKTQNLYRAKRAARECRTLVDWLRDDFDPLEDAEAPNKRWFSRRNIAPYTSEETPFTHPELERARDLLERLADWPEEVVSWERVRFVVQARRRLEDRCRAAGQQTYSDLLRVLADRLAPGSPTRERLREVIGQRFGAVLIDEFQDTDARQWRIFETVFGGGDHHLYLIGDPKQAIYAFRGANVHVYERAVETASAVGRVATMGRNFRSDRRLVEGLNGLWGGGPDWFGSAAIRYEPVGARHEQDRLVPPEPWSDPVAAPLQIRFLDRACLGDEEDPDWLKAGEISDLLPSTVAADVLALLERKPRLGAGDEARDLGPGDVAVLVRTGHQAGRMVAALRALGLPAVRSGGSSIFKAPATLVIQAFLGALEAPRTDFAARRLALAPPFAWTGDDLARLNQEDPETLVRWEGWLAGLALWRGIADKRGVLPAWRRCLDDTDALSRLLLRPDGERLVTDLQHLVELIHEVQVSERLRLPALLRWFAARRAGADDRAEEEQLRLERDDAAVQVVTIHGSKGLQYPVVFLPWLWRSVREPGAKWLVVPSEQEPSARVLDLRSPGAKADALLRGRREARTEEMRLAYVALTRACHRAVLYCGAIRGVGSSPAGTLLHGAALASPEDLLDEVEVRVEASSAAELWAGIEARVAALVAEDGTPLAAASRIGPLGIPGTWEADPERQDLRARGFERPGLDRVWGRTSYTSLVRDRDFEAEDPEGREAGHADHDQQSEASAADFVLVPPPPLDLAGLDDVGLAVFPRGADAGTCLHAVFEHLDFQGDEAHVREVTRDQLLRHGLDPGPLLEPVVPALVEVLVTPLGGALGTHRLADIPRGQRLDELRFDLPIAGGDQHRRGRVGTPESARLDGRALAAALATPIPRVRSAYLEAVAGIDFGPLAGFLTGSIDLVFRGPDGRWWVADYKSNRLDPHRTGRCVGAQFAQAWLAHEMERHHYYLQGTLYALALHRWLRARLGREHYDPARDLGGAAYLFVRGMVGPDTPAEGGRRQGVCQFKPSLEVLERLDALFEDPLAAGGSR